MKTKKRKTLSVKVFVSDYKKLINKKHQRNKTGNKTVYVPDLIHELLK